MKSSIFFIFILCISTFLYAVDVAIEKDGALLWAENCMGCHFPQNFMAAEPDEGYVDDLINDIDFNIYAPESGMSFLYYLTNEEIRKIAHFLIYRSHSDKWVSEGLHGLSARDFGNDNCLKCHDNGNLYKEPPLSCNVCH